MEGSSGHAARMDGWMDGWIHGEKSLLETERRVEPQTDACHRWKGRLQWRAGVSPMTTVQASRIAPMEFSREITQRYVGMHCIRQIDYGHDSADGVVRLLLL